MEQSELLCVGPGQCCLLCEKWQLSSASKRSTLQVSQGDNDHSAERGVTLGQDARKQEGQLFSLMKVL